MNTNKFLCRIALCGIIACPLTATAVDETYFSVGYALVNSEVLDEDYDTGMIIGTFGKVLSPNLAVEGVLGFGIQDDEWTSANGCDSATASTDSTFGVRARAFTELSPNLSGHAMIGFQESEATLEISGAASCYGIGWSESYSESDSDLTYGFGIAYALSPKNAVTVDYTVFYDDEDLTVSGIVLSYRAMLGK